jgi:hypothetical protein
MRTKRPAAGAGKGRRGAKVGDSREAAAAAFGGAGDFGAPETDVRERNYASTAARNQDPGGMPGHSVGEGTRDTGVGGNDSGVGSSSGGDIDVDVVGVGDGIGMSAGGPDERTDGADMVSSADNPSDTNAARNSDDKGRRNRPRPPLNRRIEGTTIDRSGGDRDTLHEGRGSASVNGPADERNDDSFLSEISNDEAAGADNSDSDRL